MNYSFTIFTAVSIVIVSLFSAFMAGGAVLGIGLNESESSQKTYALLSFIVGQGFMIVPLILFLIKKKEPILMRLRLNPVDKHILFLSFLLSFGVIILSDEFDRIVQIFFPAPDYIINMDNLLKPESPLALFLLFVAVSLLAPIGEELLFRGFFQQFLESYWKDITKAVLFTSLFFAIIHMNPFWFIQIYILGVLLGYLAWKTNSIFPSLILHSLNNTVAIIISYGNLDKTSLYVKSGHINPIILVFAFFLIYVSFNKIKKFQPN